MSSQANRATAGQPTGGQFINQSRPEAAIELVLPSPRRPGFFGRDSLPNHLATLSTSEDSADRVAAATHVRSRTEVRWLLTYDDDPEVRSAVAGAVMTEVELLHRLASDHIADVRRVVATRHTTDPDSLWRLIHDPDRVVSLYASQTLEDLGLEHTPFDLGRSLADLAAKAAAAEALTSEPRYGVRVTVDHA